VTGLPAKVLVASLCFGSRITLTYESENQFPDWELATSLIELTHFKVLGHLDDGDVVDQGSRIVPGVNLERFGRLRLLEGLNAGAFNSSNGHRERRRSEICAIITD
jgi:hypothetical protein